MFCKYSVLVLVGICGLIGESQAQEGCVVETVQDLHLNITGFLQWSINSTEGCQIIEYQVKIWELNGTNLYNLSVTEPRANVSFLTICHEYLFLVTPVAERTQGPTQFLASFVPIPPDSDLSIGSIDFLHNVTTGRTLVNWTMSIPEYAKCKLTYRVIVEEEANAVIEDLYVVTNSLDMYALPVCKTYVYGIRAINVGHPSIEGPMKMASFHIRGQIQTSPTLLLVKAGARYANLSFILDSKFSNPCEVTEFYIDGGDFFERTIHINDLDPFRQPVNVSLTGLEPNSMYFFQAWVKNSLGWSNPTRGAFQTLEDSSIPLISEP